ncbi:MAG: aconitate hydratase [Candidatus Hydrogenedentota bacterium]
MNQNVARKLIADHLLEGEMTPGTEIALRIDQTLTQDATGTLVMLELLAMGLDRAHTELSAQYVDHNLLQEDSKNSEDHLFLLGACQRLGIWYSRAGNGVSHPLHQAHFGKPGKSLLGSDSHTCAAGALGMLAIGAGGLEVALAIAGDPFRVRMPEILGVQLTGSLPDWVSAKDVILEMLRRHGVKGGVGRIVEYYGPGVETLSVMDRHVIANMGAELGATTTVFPADEMVRDYLRDRGRESDWSEWKADDGADYDMHDEIDLSSLVPLIAMPTSPGNVCEVQEVAGEPIYQAYIGSSANPGYRDFAIAAQIVKSRRVNSRVSLDINPTSREILEELAQDGRLVSLIHSGARIHQAGCNGCIGMGQAPVANKLSLRTVPRNFPGRSGTDDDRVCLVSPETAAASALTGCVTDPRTLDFPYPKVSGPANPVVNDGMFVKPLPPEDAKNVTIEKGGNIVDLPECTPLPESLALPILLRVGDDVSTDEIMPAGSRVLPFRSNIPRISDFVYQRVDAEYVKRAKEQKKTGGHLIVGGTNYGQGSSREHAALAPRYLGLSVVIAKSFARIHWQNLVNWGILPLTFADESDYDRLAPGAVAQIRELYSQLRAGNTVEVLSGGKRMKMCHQLSPNQVEVLEAGGLVNLKRNTIAR